MKRGLIGVHLTSSVAIFFSLFSVFFVSSVAEHSPAAPAAQTHSEHEGRLRDSTELAEVRR